MKSNPEKFIARWLKAEKEGRWQEAEAALRSTFLRLPGPAVPPTLLGRILEQQPHRLAARGQVSSIHQPAAGRAVSDPFSRPAWRGLIAASFLLFGCLFGGLPSLLSAAGDRLSVGLFIGLLERVSIFVSRLLAGAVSLVGGAIELAPKASEASSSPVFLLCVIVLSVVSVAALRLFSEFSVRQKGFRHVDAA
jgi:hypothetical protein